MKVIVTGDNGYIGSVLAPLLVEAGHEVVGLDAGLFRKCSLSPNLGSVPSVRKDIRDVTAGDLAGFDAVVHLAALSNDPMGNLNTAWTREINLEASLQLAESAKAAGVERFLFSSSCIMYGLSDAATVWEDSPLDPKTEYARSKVEGEAGIAGLADDGFSPVFLRNGTVYGPSPRMRFDTVLNNLVGSAVATGEVVIRSDGEPWRPVVNVRDVARAFVTVLEAPRDVIHNQAFNVGAEQLNHQIKDLARIAIDAVRGAKLIIMAEPQADQRTYRANFDKFAQTFPGFVFEWHAEAGARDLAEFLRGVGTTKDTFVDRRFTRLKWLEHLLHTRALDSSLRWSTKNGESAT